MRYLQCAPSFIPCTKGQGTAALIGATALIMPPDVLPGGSPHLRAGAPQSFTRLPYARPSEGIQLAGTLYDSTDLAFSAWEWLNGLGAPAALVAGAVLVTLHDTRAEMSPRKGDKKGVRWAKQLVRFFYVSVDCAMHLRS